MRLLKYVSCVCDFDDKISCTLKLILLTKKITRTFQRIYDIPKKSFKCLGGNFTFLFTLQTLRIALTKSFSGIFR